MADINMLLLLLKNINGVGDSAIRRLIMNNCFNDAKNLETYSDYLNWIKKNDIYFTKRDLISALTIEDIEKANKKAVEIEELSKSKKIGMITYFDETYPTRFKNMISSKDCDFPVILYYLGDISLLNSEKICAIIGTREISKNASEYGKKIAKRMVDDGYIIVSGLASGCDTIGHKGCLEAGGKTIAIVATPLDTVFPKSNRDLQEEIIKNGGLVISEYPIGFKGGSYTFVQRDRLQASSSDIVIALQTSINGGTMHAAKATRKYNKKLLTIMPDLVSDGETSGNKELITFWGATPITDEWFTLNNK